MSKLAPYLASALVVGALSFDASAQDTIRTTDASTGAAETAVFTAPVRLEAAGKLVRVESPGYASPCWADVDGDGKKDLVVGQFNDGKMMVYKNLGGGKLAKGKWLEAGGKGAEVPGIW